MDVTTVQWEPSSGWSGAFPGRDGPRTLVMAYGHADLLDAPGPIDDLVAAYPASVVIGCSTAGEILRDAVFDGTLTVAVATFATTSLAFVCERVLDHGHSYATGLSVGKQLFDAQPGLRSLFVLCDGLTVNGSALVSGLLDGTGHDVVITGGLAGDGQRFGRTWVVAGGAARSGWVTAVGLSGPDFVLGYGSRGGWDIFGPERRVTRSAGSVLYELDGLPALELYKRYLGDRAAGLPATALLFPLAVRRPGAVDRQLVRTIVAVDEAEQSLTFAGDVPEGSLAQLMHATFDRLVDAASAAAASSAVEVSGDSLAVVISCVGRRLALGRRTEDELEAAAAGLPAGATMVGFYSYGEITPLAAGTCDLHNQTMTITTLGEVG